jgi:nucleoside phosphorylase
MTHTDDRPQAGARPRVGLLIAMRAERPACVPEPPSGHPCLWQTGRGAVGVVICGVGQKRARAAAERLCAELHPEMLLSLGTCGAAGKRLAVGELLLAERVVHRGQAIATTGPCADELQRRLAGRLNVRTGEVETVDRPAFSRRGLAVATLGVEMEAYAIAQVAALHGLPALVVKAASDTLPEQPGLGSLLKWLRHWQANFGLAKRTLNEFARIYFEVDGPRATA